MWVVQLSGYVIGKITKSYGTKQGPKHNGCDNKKNNQQQQQENQYDGSSVVFCNI